MSGLFSRKKKRNKVTEKDYRIWGKILGGKEYTDEETPEWWRNGKYLPYFYLHISFSQLPFIDPARLAECADDNKIDPEALPLNGFPLIEDFEVVLWGTFFEKERASHPEKEPENYRARFFSPTYGLLVSFFIGEYGVQDLLADTFRLPRGDFTLPYFDFDQGWILLIAEWEGFVYILSGIFEEIQEKKGYHTWFKVEKQRYYSQWENALRLCQETFQDP